MKLALLALFLLPLPLAAAPALVQAKHTNTIAASDTTVTATFNSAVTAGNLIVVWASWGSQTITISSITDSLSNTYSLIGNTLLTDTTNSQRCEQGFAANIAGGTNTVTVTFSDTVGFRGLTIAEFSGLATASPLDKSAGQDQVSTTAPSSTSVTPVENGELIFSATIDSSNGSVSITLESTLVSNTGVTDGTGSQYEVQATAAAIAGDFTFSAARDAMTSISTFKAAGGGAPAFPAAILNRPLLY